MVGCPVEEGVGEFPRAEAREDGLDKGRGENGGEAVQFRGVGVGLFGEDRDEDVDNRSIGVIIIIVMGRCGKREFAEDREKRMEFEFLCPQCHQSHLDDDNNYNCLGYRTYL